MKARGVNEMGEAFKTACTHLEGRPTEPLVHDLGSNLLPTPPQLVSFRRPKEGSCGGNNPSPVTGSFEVRESLVRAC